MGEAALANHDTLPRLGFGTWRLSDKATCEAAVHEAIKAGYRFFDTAQNYGNESFVGSALRQSGLPRINVSITTKIRNENLYWYGLVDSFHQSLARLQTEYVDELLIHFPVTELRRPAWRRMEEIAMSGLARSIGVSNYTIRHLQELLDECTIPPAVNQIEHHVYLQQPELVAFCKENDIVVEAYAPLAHGSRHGNPVLAEIGRQYNKTPAQIMLRWCLERGTVPLPKAKTPAHIHENIDVFDFSLSDDDMVRLQTLEANYRTSWDPTHVP